MLLLRELPCSSSHPTFRGSKWYRFDDDKLVFFLPISVDNSRLTDSTFHRVYPSTLPNVLNPPAPVYMAFYVKRRLDYKPDMTPTYILARETEAQKERERERLEKERKDREAIVGPSAVVGNNGATSGDQAERGPVGGAGVNDGAQTGMKGLEGFGDVMGGGGTGDESAQREREEREREEREREEKEEKEREEREEREREEREEREREEREQEEREREEREKEVEDELLGML